MFLEKIALIKAFILDIDGVLTDGTVLVTDTGDQLRRFNVRDGYAMKLAVKRGFKICSISGGKSESVVLRLKSLGITEVHLGIDDKIGVFEKFLETHGLRAEEVLYVGDDVPDLPVLRVVGIGACPSDAIEEVKEVCTYISPKNGGEGCVRDIIEKVLKVQQRWYEQDPSSAEKITSA